jgi:hypothetical protein
MAKILLAAVFAVGLCVLSGCAESAERPALLAAAARNLRCPPTEMEAQLSRETAKVREYYVACDFVYTTVHCADGRCFPAKPKQPCFGGGCFTEDPVTLEWTLDDPQVDLKHVDH